MTAVLNRRPPAFALECRLGLPQGLEKRVCAERRKYAAKQEAVKAARGKLTRSIPIPEATYGAAGTKALTAVLSKLPPAHALERRIGLPQDPEKRICAGMKGYAKEQEAVKAACGKITKSIPSPRRRARRRA